MALTVMEPKIVMLGSQDVGKTSIVLRYLKRRNPLGGNSTIGASFFTYILHVDNIKFQLQIWDTAGQERFRSMTPLYYRKAQAAIIVYDTTDINTFTATKGWIEELNRNTSEKALVLCIVGNKTDLVDRRAVSKEDGLELAHDHSAIYLETSAATGEGIADVFLEVCLALAREQSLGKDNENTNSTDGINSIERPDRSNSTNKDSQQSSANMCSC